MQRFRIAPRHGLVAVGIVLMAAGFGARAAGDAVCSAAALPAELDFTLEDIDGNAVTLSDHLGDVILLDFWATWCAPCREEIPRFIELYDRYGPSGFVVLGVSVSDTVETLVPYAEELGMSYPVLVGKERFDLQEAYGPLYGFPTSFLISRDGTICVRHTGIASKEELEREIMALL